MGGLLQPVHLVFILLIVLILFGPGKLPEHGRGMGGMHSDLRGEWSSFRNALFMAKGVDPGVGRDVGDMLPDEEARRSKTWARMLLAILLGNLLYFVSSPLLPAAAVLNGEKVSALPALVDIWFCVLVFGVLSLIRPPGQRRNSKPTTRNEPPLR
jgi:TatA/E family protein of Tat protein translocase